MKELLEIRSHHSKGTRTDVSDNLRKLKVNHGSISEVTMPLRLEHMTEYNDMAPKFVNSSSLEYVDKYSYCDSSVYRGQIKKIDDIRYKKLMAYEDKKAANIRNASLDYENSIIIKDGFGLAY